MFYPKILTFSFLFLLPFLSFSDPPTLKLSSGSQPSQGIIKLEWTSSPNAGSSTFELQQSLNSDFNSSKLIYEGIDKGSFLSGLHDGEYFFRVREQGGSWSMPVAVEVEHHPLQLALVLMLIGAIVFISTVILVIKGSKSSRTSL